MGFFQNSCHFYSTINVEFPTALVEFPPLWPLKRPFSNLFPRILPLKLPLPLPLPLPQTLPATSVSHDLDLVCCAHQVVEDGYEFFAQRQLVTVFSAPNYCGEFDNAGAMMSVDDTLMCSFQILKPAEKRHRLSEIFDGPADTPPAKKARSSL